MCDTDITLRLDRIWSAVDTVESVPGTPRLTEHQSFQNRIQSDETVEAVKGEPAIISA